MLSKQSRYKTHKLAATVTLILAFSPIAFLFQNCGKGFVAEGEGFAVMASTAPTIVITESPQRLTNVRTSTVRFSTSVNALSAITKLTCQHNLEAEVPCSDQIQLSNLVDGDHVLTLRAEDSRGNKSIDTIVNWRVDGTAPQVVINSGPQAIAGVATAAIIFTATDNLSGVNATECSYNGAAFAACVSPQNFANLAQMAHSLRVRARDLAGNTSTEVVHNWRVDLTAPVVTILTGPNNISNSRAAAFTFNGTDDGVALTNFQCAVDNGAFAPCTGSVSFENLADGNHTFTLRAADNAGNLSAPVTRNWLVDATAPTVAFMATPTNPSGPSPIFRFTGTDNVGGSGIAGYLCSSDNTAFVACVSPFTFARNTSITHLFAVQARDNAGNLSATVTYSWRMDATPPSITGLTEGPYEANVPFYLTYSVNETATVVCEIPGVRALSACTRDRLVLGPGDYSLIVTATDTIGNRSTVTSNFYVVAAATKLFETTVAYGSNFNGALEMIVGNYIVIAHAKHSESSYTPLPATCRGTSNYFLSFINIANPANPVLEVGGDVALPVPAACLGRALLTYQNGTLNVSSEYYYLTYDISSPKAPRLVSSLNLRRPDNELGYKYVPINANFAVINTEFNCYIYEVNGGTATQALALTTNPVTGQYNQLRALKCLVVGNRLWKFVTNHSSANATHPAVQVYDISNPRAPISLYSGRPSYYVSSGSMSFNIFLENSQIVIQEIYGEGTSNRDTMKRLEYVYDPQLPGNSITNYIARRLDTVDPVLNRNLSVPYREVDRQTISRRVPSANISDFGSYDLYSKVGNTWRLTFLLSNLLPSTANKMIVTDKYVYVFTSSIYTNENGFFTVYQR